MLDRNRYGRDLSTKLKHQRGRQEKSILVGVIEGPESELPTTMVERFSMLEISKGLEKSNGSIRRANIQVQTSKGETLEEWWARIQEELCDSCSIDLNKVPDRERRNWVVKEVGGAIRKKSAPTVFYSTIHISGFSRTDRQALRRWLQFWSNISHHGLSRPILIFICIIKSGSWRLNPLAWYRNHNMYRILNENFELPDNGILRIKIPKLTPVPVSEVHEWIHNRVSRVKIPGISGLQALFTINANKFLKGRKQISMSDFIETYARLICGLANDDRG